MVTYPLLTIIFSNFSAINPDQLTLANDALETLIEHYCRESGVRNLQKHIEKIFRKAAYQIVKDREKGTTEDSNRIVDKKNLQDYVGDNKYISGRIGFLSK
jgi:Lon-like ATP-dependent protease